MITIAPERVGMIDTASKDVIEAEKKEEIEKMLEGKLKKKKNKMRGRGSVGAQKAGKEHEMQKHARDKLKEELKRQDAKSKVERDRLGTDLKFLQAEDEKFDPLAEVIEEKANKRKKID